MPGADFLDTAPFFDVEEFGAAAIWRPEIGSSVASVVILDAPDQQLFDNVTARDRSCVYRTTVWPTVDSGDRIEIGADAYHVRRIERLDDGALARAWLTLLPNSL